jgi:hypothetical protein
MLTRETSSKRKMYVMCTNTFSVIIYIWMQIYSLFISIQISLYFDSSFPLFIHLNKHSFLHFKQHKNNIYEHKNNNEYHFLWKYNQSTMSRDLLVDLSSNNQTSGCLLNFTVNIRITIILLISYSIFILFYIKSWHYYILRLCTKRTLIIW